MKSVLVALSALSVSASAFAEELRTRCFSDNDGLIQAQVTAYVERGEIPYGIGGAVTMTVPEGAVVTGEFVALAQDITDPSAIAYDGVYKRTDDAGCTGRLSLVGDYNSKTINFSLAPDSEECGLNETVAMPTLNVVDCK